LVSRAAREGGLGSHHLQPSSPGTLTYRIVADPKNRLQETNENNNVVSGTLTVRER